MKAVNAIEAAANRTREIHWGPRTLDVDIVLYDERLLQTVIYLFHIGKCIKENLY